MQCPGWIKLANSLPAHLLDSGGSAADMGSLCHAAIDLLVRGKVLRPSSLLGMQYNKQVLGQEQLDDLILPALEMFHDAVPQDYTHLLTEQRVDLASAHVPPGTLHGTADVVAKYPSLLIVLDWKFGMVPVPPSSPQFFFYAAGALNTLFPDLPLDFPVRLVVIQPRVSRQAQVFECEVERVLRWQAEYDLAVHASLQVSPSQATGHECKYCPARAICDTYLGRTRSLVVDAPELLSAGRLAELADGIPLAQGYSDAVSIEVKKALEAGADIPGWKRVAGRARKSWRDEAEAAEVLESILGEEAYVKKVLTPAAAAAKLPKALGDEVLRALVDVGRDPPRIVRADDPHPALDAELSNSLTEALSTLLKRN